MVNLELGDVHVILYEAKTNVRRVIKFALNELGFRDIEECSDIWELKFQCMAHGPDLLIFDLDESVEDVCTVMNDIRHRQFGIDPFIVSIATTWQANEDKVRAALNCGVDDILMKPLSVQILDQRIVNLIHNRHGFIATDDYIGPERRSRGRDEDRTLPVLQTVVPNSLRYKATGDEDALVDDAAVRRALEAIELQKYQRISIELSTLCHELGLLAFAGDSNVIQRKLGEVLTLLTEVTEFTSDRDWLGVNEITDSMNYVISAIAKAAEPAAKQFEVLKLHSQALSTALIHSKTEAEVLAQALKQAVDATENRTADAASNQ